jgi:hypothetical protein
MLPTTAISVSYCLQSPVLCGLSLAYCHLCQGMRTSGLLLKGLTVLLTILLTLQCTLYCCQQYMYVLDVPGGSLCRLSAAAPYVAVDPCFGCCLSLLRVSFQPA